MASSGTISSAFLGYRIQIAWSVTSQSVADNTSTVAVNVQLVSTGSSWTINSGVTKSGSLSINGTSYAFTFNTSLTGNQTKTIHTRTVTVPHNADGTKTCSFSCSAGIAVTLSGTYYGSVSTSGTGTFNTIARATTPTLSASTFEIGSSVTISTPRASSGFTHTLTWVFGNQSGSIASGVATSYAWTVPMQLCLAIPNGTTGTGSIVCATYSGSTLIGTREIWFTATVPASVVPTISSVSVSEATEGIATQFGGYVQGKSRANVSVAASGAYYSRITSYKVTVDGATFYGQSITSGILTTAGTKSVVVTVTDSRGRTATSTQSITVLAYTAPTIASFTCSRTNANGVENDEGTYLKANINFSIASVNSKNSKSWSLQYKRQSASEWTTLTSGSVYAYDSSYLSTSGILSADYAFDIRLVISDFFATAEKTVQIGTAYTLMDFNSSGKGIAFGKVSEQDAFECAMKIIASKGFRLGNSEILEPSAVSVTLGGTNFKKIATSDYEILPMTAATIVGSGLTVSNNGILIGSGITKIRISAQICYGAATAGLKTCAIWSSASTSHLARSQMNITNASYPESIAISPRIAAVTAGNVITLRCHGTENDIIYGGLMQTYLTVEAVG